MAQITLIYGDTR